MSTQNICKFIKSFNEDRIYTQKFVYEKSGNTFCTTVSANAVYLVVSGSGRLTTDSVKADLRAGNIFFTFENLAYKIESVNNFQYMYITFSGNRSVELFARFGITPVKCVFEGHEGITTFWQNAIAKAGEKNLDLISEAVLLYTFGEMAPYKESAEQQLIRSMVKYIENNFTDNSTSLQSMSNALGYNGKYLSRIFKTSIGINFSSYLTNVRIQNAVFLMEQGVTAIKNVALLSGYKDPFYFSSVFKSVIGMSPSEYIESIKNSSK
ncbi:MAG: helix-turn-helix transcriptional regulator [Clostridia bacterium]|nr:helix-turn-helix transcriptional regulator [Clostridia bacterium]